jgi:hypothetical protein
MGWYPYIFPANLYYWSHFFMAQSAFTRESALDYLASRGLLTKGREDYTTAYAKRLASSYRKAETSGKRTSRAAARGKAGPEHIVPNKNPEAGPVDRFAEQYRIGFPETVSDLKSLKLSVDRRRRAKGLPKANPYTLTMHGKSRYKHPANQGGTYTDQTLSMHISASDMQDYLKNHPDMPILDFVNHFWQPMKQSDEWESIISIAMKVGNQ